MATYYVGAGGNDGNAGTSWATRLLTLNGAEDGSATPDPDRPAVAAGDTVYVGPGTYREMLTCDVSGGAGAAISYIGDYTGANTDGTGGLVRITGADNETTTGARANCITANGKNYRTFRGFLLDGASAYAVSCIAAGTNWTVDQCVILSDIGGVTFSGAAQSANAVTNCVIISMNTSTAATGVLFTHSSAVDNTAQVVQSCMVIGGDRGIYSSAVGGITVSNCAVSRCITAAIRVAGALTAGQTMTVNNCLVYANNIAMRAVNLGELVENYNTLYGNTTARTNVDTGANSVTYPPGFDMRPYFEAFNAGTLVVPLLSLASYSGLVEYDAGTGAPAADIRGHAVAGAKREWGPEEYVSTYLSECAAAGGGMLTGNKRGNKE